MSTFLLNKRTFGPTPRYDLVRAYKREDERFIVISGPCSIEDGGNYIPTIQAVSELPAEIRKYHRGGIYRAGTYPPEQFGLVNISLLEAYAKALRVSKLNPVIEIMHTQMLYHLGNVFEDSAVLQIGARNMQSYALLRSVPVGSTVFIKQSVGSKIDELLGACEYILQRGAHPIIIHRGISTHANHSRWTADVSIIPAIKAITDIPVLIDASHATGRRDLVEPVTYAGIAAGADGFLLEIHPEPDESISDADQALPVDALKRIFENCIKIKEAIKS